MRSGCPEAARRVANVWRRSWKLDLPDASGAARGLEALGHLRAVQRGAGLRVREHELAIPAILGALGPSIQLARKPVGHRHRAPCRQVRLAIRGVLTPHERVADTDALSSPIDIPPAQPEQLRLAQTGHRSSQHHNAQHRPKDIRWRRRRRAATAAASGRRCPHHDLARNRPQHHLELVEGQELEIEVHVTPTPTTGARGTADWVLAHPAAIDRVLDDRVQEAQDVADRLRREAIGEHRRRERLRMSGRQVIDRQPANTRRDVDALHGLAALQVRGTSAAKAERLPQRITNLVDRGPAYPTGRLGRALLRVL